MPPAAAAPAYNTDLRAPIEVTVSDRPCTKGHGREWDLVLAGEPVEINPALGHGFKVMTIDEWSARWKRNDDYPACANCGGTGATREHHFVQTWCRGKKTWDAESLCVACGAFTRRRYADPDFRTPEQVEAAAWAALMKGGEGGK